MGNKIGRNQKCPCGSGRKYKQCCMRRDQSRRSMEMGARRSAPPQPRFLFEEDDLDELSNKALDLTNASRFEEAEGLCRELEERYPDQIDHLDRLGGVREAQGRFGEAAALYRRCAEFARTHDGFDEHSVAYHEKRAREMDARA